MAKESSNKEENRSLWGDAWRRLKKNKPAMVGLLIICFSIIIAVLGGNIRPDETENANDQNWPIQELTPGTEINHLLMTKNEEVETSGFFGKLLMGGSAREHKRYPYLSYSFEGSNIIIEEFAKNYGTDYYMASYKSYSVADILYPLDVLQDKKYVEDGNGNMTIKLLDGTTVTRSIDEMIQEVKDEHFITETYYLGTDSSGRDYLSRLMAGTIISLSVGLISVLISLIIGITLGAIAGYYRGWVDEAIMFLINVVWSVPALLLIISITLVIGKGFVTVFLAVGLIMWVDLARLVRGQVLSIREKEFIEAGKALGFSDARIIFKHVFPNIIGPVIVQSASNFAAAILLEAGLSFLGIGTKIPMASWGTIITTHQSLFNNPDQSFLAILPGLAIMVLVFSFMLLGNGLRDAFDSKAIDA